MCVCVGERKRNFVREKECMDVSVRMGIDGGKIIGLPGVPINMNWSVISYL